MAANFILNTEPIATDDGSCLPTPTYDGCVTVSIVDANCATVSSLVLNSGGIVSGGKTKHPIQSGTGDGCEITLNTTEDFSTDVTGHQYRFDYKYRTSAPRGNGYILGGWYGNACGCGGGGIVRNNSGCGCSGKITKGTYYVPIQAAAAYTLDPENLVQVGTNGSTTCGGTVSTPSINDTISSFIGQEGLLNTAPLGDAPWYPPVAGSLQTAVAGHYVGSTAAGGDTNFEIINQLGAQIATGSIPAGQISTPFSFTHPMAVTDGIAARVVAPFPTTPASGLVITFTFTPS